MRLTLLLVLLLLCSCVTQRGAERYFDDNPEELAAYVDENEALTQRHGAAYAARHFSVKPTPPALAPTATIQPGRLAPWPLLERSPAARHYSPRAECPKCDGTHTTKTVYLQDTTNLNALGTELRQVRTTNKGLTQQLERTEKERDYWQDMNRKKFWTLIAMAIFALLFILFRVLASRVRVS